MQVRKVVTGHDAKGRAVIARDETQKTHGFYLSASRGGVLRPGSQD
jgi:hypothetical protein